MADQTGASPSDLLTRAKELDRARALLLSIAAEHDGADKHGDHAWRKCRRCLAVEELDHVGVDVALRKFVAEYDRLTALVASLQQEQEHPDAMPPSKEWYIARCHELNERLEERNQTIAELGAKLEAAQQEQERLREELQLGHLRIDECATQDAKGQPIRERISAVIQRLANRTQELEHIVAAIGAEKDELRAKAEGAAHRAAAAEYRAQRIVLELEREAALSLRSTPQPKG